MALTNDALWFIQPFQVFSTLGGAVNFGGTILQSILIMPLLQLPQTPVKYACQETAYLIQNSEHLFPPLNAACTLTNFLLTIIVFLNRTSNPVAAAKLPYLCMALAANIATTIYAVAIMLPMNNAQCGIALTLKDRDNEKEEKELRRLQKRWSKMNYGRTLFMILGSVAGMMALLAHA